MQEIKYEKGCASQAWADMRASGHWFGRSMLMALIMAIPVLRWFAIGYFYNVGRNAIRAEKEEYPTKLFTGLNFKHGFFGIVVMLVVELIVALILCICLVPCGNNITAITIVTGLVLAVMFFFAIFVGLAILRIVSVSFGEGLNLKKVKDAYTRNFSELFLVNFCPLLLTLVAMLVLTLVLTIVLVVMGMGSINTLIAVINAKNVSLLLGMLGSFALVFTIYFYLMFVISMISAVVIARANGIYIARYVPEWKQDSFVYQPVAPSIKEFTAQAVKEDIPETKIVDENIKTEKVEDNKDDKKDVEKNATDVKDEKIKEAEVAGEAIEIIEKEVVDSDKDTIKKLEKDIVVEKTEHETSVQTKLKID